MTSTTSRRVVIHQFPPAAGDTLSASPFCAKLEVFCKLFGIPFELKNGMDTHPKTKKMPWIEFFAEGELTPATTLADSSTCMNFLVAEFGIASTLTAAEAAVAHLLHRTLDEHVYWTTVRARWCSEKSPAFLATNYFGGAPQFVVRNTVDVAFMCLFMIKLRSLQASFIVWMAGMSKVLWDQGTGRYALPEVIVRLEADCAAITQLLSGREAGRFLFNSPTPNPIDAVVFAHLNALLKQWDGNFAITPRTATGPIMAYLADVRKHLGLSPPL